MNRSDQTKHEIARAFKELLQTKPFHKIVISEITEKADVSRKTFYYHFCDKFQLVTWIFDTEFGGTMEQSRDSGWECLEKLCCYLDSEAEFYRSVFKYDGQNCIGDYIGQYLRRIIALDVAPVTNGTEGSCVNLQAEALLAMIKYWLVEMEDTGAVEFIGLLRKIMDHPSAGAVPNRL